MSSDDIATPPLPDRAPLGFERALAFESAGDTATLMAAAREPGRFDADTAVHPLAGGRYSVDLAPRWNGFGPNGGYLAAVLLRAMSHALAQPTHVPRSLTVHFARGATAGSAVVDVAVLRRGRTVCSVEARLLQQEAICTVGLGAFIPQGSGPEFSEAPMPDLPDPETLRPNAFDARRMPPFTACWDGRPAGALPFAGAAEMMFKGWLRLAEPRRPDAFSVAAMTDALAPSVTARMAAPTHFMPTVDLTVHFPNPVPDRLEPDHQFAIVMRSHVASAGVVVEDGWIWTRDGLLVAQSRQLAVLVEAGRP